MIIAAAIAATVLVAYLAASAYGATKAVPIPRHPIEQFPEGMTYEDVSFLADGLTLQGWYFPTVQDHEGEHAIVIVNGGEMSRVDSLAGTLDLTRDLVDAGFGVLLFDMRGRGESDGKALALTHTSEDISAAVEFLRTNHDKVSIIAYSMGAAATLIYAKDAEVTSIVSDCCFAHVAPMFVEEAVRRGNPRWLVEILTPGTLLMAKFIYGYEKTNPVDIAADITCPILFIHGGADTQIPTGDSVELKQARSNPQDELWLVPGAEHCQEYILYPSEYVAKVVNFIDSVIEDD